MNDMSSAIIPKSDQINADSLIAGPMTVTIKDVQIRGGEEQPVSIALEQTKLVYRPCKSMSRVLVQAWGADAKKYIGRSLTLYRDPTVKWAGLEVGGIRISHLSHIDGPKQMVLTATKGSRKPHKVLPLTDAPATQQQPATEDAAVKWADAYIAKLPTLDLEAFNPFLQSKAAKLMELKEARPELYDRVTAAVEQRKNELVRPQPTFIDDDTSFDSQPAGGADYDGV